MERLYFNLLILFILIIVVILIHFYGSKPEHFFNIYDFAPIPYFNRPLLNYFDNEPSGYDSGTRDYNNPIFAREVAQGLDTN